MTDLLDAARRVVESTYRKNTRMDPMPGAVDDLEAALEAYEYSGDTPQRSGKYFLRPFGESPSIAVTLWPKNESGELWIWVPLEGYVRPASDLEDWEWAGPIPEPTDPE